MRYQAERRGHGPSFHFFAVGSPPASISGLIPLRQLRSWLRSERAGWCHGTKSLARGAIGDLTKFSWKRLVGFGVRHHKITRIQS